MSTGRPLGDRIGTDLMGYAAISTPAAEGPVGRGEPIRQGAPGLIRDHEMMYPAIREAYLKMYEAGKKNPRAGVTEKAFQNPLAYERGFVRAGGLLAAGVDNTGNGGALAGFGDQRNLEILVEAGFTAAEALQIMSLNGAKILGVDKDLGSVEAGKLADFAVVRGNPATNPRDLRNTVIVFKDGVGYDPAKILADVKGVVGLR